jgi:hypothetical protein
VTGATTGLALLILLAVAPSAHAQKEVNGFIGGDPGTAGGQFLQPTDVAVHHGDAENPADDKILVTEGLGSNSRVQRLDADGNFELAWGRDVVRAGMHGDRGTRFEVCSRAPACKAGVLGARPGELAKPSGIAVNAATGDVYVVDGGNRRIQRFELDGRFVGAWKLDPDDRAGRFQDAAIAISPTAPHDVFVADGAHDRVLQFDADGRFLRAWGWGVDTGAARFEVCTSRSGCGAGRPVPGFGRRDRSWPRHIAVDARGVVYAAVFLGVIFESSEVRTRIVRFRSRPAPDPPSAGDALLAPLRPDVPYWVEAPPSALLTNGATLGIDVDPANGRLLAINNPFGPSRMDEVENPGAPGRRPRVHVEDALPFLQNVTGLAAAGNGVVLLSSGVVEQLTGTSGFTGCARDDAKRDCHGLVALARGGPPQAVMAPGVAGGLLAAHVDPHGAARYRFQTSRDGRNWSDVAPPRYVTGTGYEPLPLPLGGLPRGLSKLRLVVTKRTDHGTERAVSGEAVGLR